MALVLIAYATPPGLNIIVYPAAYGGETHNLITSIAKATSEMTTDYINQRIEELHKEIKESEQKLADLKNLTEENALSDNEFDVLRDILSFFASSFDTMNIEKKRTAIRTFVKRIVWDGENIHMYLSGSEEGELKEPKGEDRK